MQLAWKAVLAHSTPACQEPNLVAEPHGYCIPFVKSASFLFEIVLFIPDLGSLSILRKTSLAVRLQCHTGAEKVDPNAGEGRQVTGQNKQLDKG